MKRVILAIALPGHMESLRGVIGHYSQSFFGKELNSIEFGFEEAVRQFADSSSLKLGAFLKHVWDGSLALVNMVSLFVVTPVVAFYLLLDWNMLIERVDRTLPRDHLETLRGLARKVDRTLNGFMRGQVTVCLILASIYSIGLMLVGLKHGFLIGVIAGVLSFIPYIGSAIGLVLSVGFALGQFWPDWISILMVFGVFLTGQLIEGNFPTTQNRWGSGKLASGLADICLICIWIFDGGLWGCLLQFRSAAIIGVLVRFGLERYMESELYHGKSN